MSVEDFLLTVSVQNQKTKNSNSDCGAFEGPEKLLEIWFGPSPDLSSISNIEEAPDGGNKDQRTGLRKIDKSVWEDLLRLVKCKILTSIENCHVDAYLLSESSMFVYPHKLILKTCGTTTLLVALPRLLEIASEYCQFKKVWRVFYSRKSFMFPDQQLHPHKDWKDEVAFLDHLFENGAAYTVGKINADHWNLYLTSPRKNEAGFSSVIDIEDQTIEILMTNLDRKAAEKFYHVPSEGESGTEGGSRVEKLSGLSMLYPDAQLDSYLFGPCGYSANGLFQDNYFNVHVTPEPLCSYASFETNIPETHSTIPNLIQKVISIFQPSKFTVTIFISGKDIHEKRKIASFGNIEDFNKADGILYEFDDYDLVFRHFEKKISS
ncbi:hypothetical protein G9A89_011719 [Geosiphon pyriformis]|nr:hypothetical protein G9A89_011719 [Geosiphon pyriformis]